MPLLKVVIEPGFSTKVFVPSGSDIAAVKRGLRSMEGQEFGLATVGGGPVPLPDDTPLGEALKELMVVPPAPQRPQMALEASRASSTKASQSPGKQIKMVLLCWGSRGDVQPVVALALQLKALGVIPTVLVNDLLNHHKFVRSFSLKVETYPHVEIFDAAAIMAGKKDTQVLDADTSAEELPIFRKVMQISPDVVVYSGRHSLMAWALEKLLSICTIEYGFCRAGSFQSEQRGRVAGITRDVDRLSSLLGGRLELNSGEVAGRAFLDRPFLYAVSSEVGMREPDWPLATKTSGVHFTGFWTVPKQQQHGESFGSAQEGELNRFLAGASDVIYMGWGSMHVVSSHFMAQKAVRTLRLLNCRGIILGSYSRLCRAGLHDALDAPELVSYADENVLWLRWAPHEWLMPRCQVIVQHGGCGTTAAAMRAGRPTVVTPTGFDQFYWGERVEQLGVGVCTKHLAKLTAQELAAAVRSCQTQEVQQRAAELGQRLQAEEPGAARAAKLLLEYARRVVVPGRGARPSPESAQSTQSTPLDSSAKLPPSAVAVDGQP